MLGVADDHRVVGEGSPREAVQEKLTQLLHSGLSTPVTGTFGSADVAGAFVHWVHVASLRGSQPAKVDGRVYVRRGRATVEPSETELAELYNAFGFVLTEERTLPGSSTSDVDVGRFREHLRLPLWARSARRITGHPRPLPSIRRRASMKLAIISLRDRVWPPARTDSEAR